MIMDHADSPYVTGQISVCALVSQFAAWFGSRPKKKKQLAGFSCLSLKTVYKTSFCASEIELSPLDFRLTRCLIILDPCEGPLAFDF